MFNLVEHAGHRIELKLNDNNLDVNCWDCHDTHKPEKIGSFLLKEREGER